MRIDIGAGDALEPGWISWDLRDGRDASALDAGDSTVDEIRASHVLEHVGHRKTLSVLREWRRVLKPGGRLFVAVPDFEAIVGHMAHTAETGAPADPQCELYIMGGQVDERDYHRAIFSEEKLRSLLASAGFDRIAVVGAEGANCSRHWCSLNMEAFK